ncbi:MAG: hypothetical protein J2P48_16170 [Alphaproteobacteria bacterium]|nr:hypothetical protein [Alphaproteobacteria bacterium]
MASDYLPFAYLETANIMPQAQWATLTARRSGFSIGQADSRQFNKAWRQATVVAAAVAAFIDTRVPQNIVDNGDHEALALLFAQAISSFVSGGGIGEAPTDGRSFVRRNSSWDDAAALRLDGGSW